MPLPAVVVILNRQLCHPSMREVRRQGRLQKWCLCSFEASPLTGGNKFEIRLETIHSAGTLEPLLGIDTCASDELLGIAHTADTSLYQQPVTFLNVRARGVCSNQSDSRNGLTLHKVQSDEGQAAFITLPLHSGCSFSLFVLDGVCCVQFKSTL